MRQSTLSEQLLATLWNASDETQDGKLDLFEWNKLLDLILGQLVLHVAEPHHHVSTFASPIGSTMPPLRLDSTTGKQTDEFGLLSSVSFSLTGSAPLPLGSSDWPLPKDFLKRHLDLFLSMCRAGYLTGDVATAYFRKSGLSSSELANIWELADMDHDGRLTQKEFLVAVGFIAFRLLGRPLPAYVPLSLLNEVSTPFDIHSNDISPRTAPMAPTMPEPVLVNSKWGSEEPGKVYPRMAPSLMDTKVENDFFCAKPENEPAKAPAAAAPSSPAPAAPPPASPVPSPQPTSTIQLQDLTMGDKIGTGAHASVYKASWFGQDVAVKILKCNDTTALNEIALMEKLRHPNLVMLYGVSFNDDGNVSLVMELMPQGSLQAVLHDKKFKLTWQAAKNIALDVANGMNFLHSQKPPVMHRDLKSLNVLVDDKYRAKVADFGLGRAVSSATMTVQIGSPMWMAPEMLKGEKYGLGVDVYAFGILLWELACRRYPYDAKNAFELIFLVAMQNKRPDIPSDVPPLWAQLMKQCWEADAAARPSFPQIISSLKSISFPNPLAEIKCTTF